MSKKKKPLASEPQPSLERLRARIDELDAEVFERLGERYGVVEKIQQAKLRNGSPIYQPDRERAQLERLERLNRRSGSKIRPSALRAIFREILSASRALQGSLKVAYLGPAGTYSEIAAREQFGTAAELLPVASIAEVFRAVERGEAQHGVVPFENSSEGTVGPTLDALAETPLQVVGERELLIRHALLARSKAARFRRIVSHPQSLAQCREWLARNAPGIPTIEVASNAEAAARAARSDSTAAIAGREAATRYGLKVVADAIQDVPHNVTRFLVLAPEAPSRTAKSDKVSVLFSVKNEAGRLHRTLEPLAENHLSLCKIVSRPMRGRVWSYLFFVDFWGDVSDPKVRAAIAAMRRHCLWFKVLGSYPAAQTP